MKPFNFLIIIFLTTILGGSILYKDGFTKPEIQTRALEPSQSQVLYDRIKYLDYSEQNLASSQKFGKTVLFFAATTWCSNCIALDKEIKTRIRELPRNVTILKVDYDNNKKTKAKYVVTMQTTLVLLDKNGREIKRFIGTSFDNLIQNLE